MTAGGLDIHQRSGPVLSTTDGRPGGACCALLTRSSLPAAERLPALSPACAGRPAWVRTTSPKLGLARSALSDWPGATDHAMTGRVAGVVWSSTAAAGGREYAGCGLGAGGCRAWGPASSCTSSTSKPPLTWLASETRRMTTRGTRLSVRRCGRSQSPAHMSWATTFEARAPQRTPASPSAQPAHGAAAPGEY